jgi:threonine dehydrogenase-like Zn-dependent dehydrogenase
MKAVVWYGAHDVRVERVPDPEILNAGDAIVKVSSTSICGSDLHLYDGFIPTMKKGDILGHEFMGEVVDIGRGVKRLRPGDRVVVPFPIACGQCLFCGRGEFALCDNSNPEAALAEELYGHAPAGIFGYSHLMGGYAGGQAEYVRVPFADIGPIKIDSGLSDEQVLFLSDVIPTGWQAAEQCAIRLGDVVAVWGCGPVGLLAIKSAYRLGASRVIAIDRFTDRLRMAEDACGAAAIDYREVDVLEALKELTGGRGPDACIDAVGMEAHGTGLPAVYDKAASAVRFETERLHAVRQAIVACRKGGTVSLAGVYGGFADKIPLGAAFNKGLTFKMGQTHVQRHLSPLLREIEEGRIDATFIITHRFMLDDASIGYRTFRDKKDGCVKVVLRP